MYKKGCEWKVLMPEIKNMQMQFVGRIERHNALVKTMLVEKIEVRLARDHIVPAGKQHEEVNNSRVRECKTRAR